MNVCMWSFGNNRGVCGQLAFLPEYLAPPAERVKKERKSKTPKIKREATGKVRGGEGKELFTESGDHKTEELLQNIH